MPTVARLRLAYKHYYRPRPCAVGLNPERAAGPRAAPPARARVCHIVLRTCRFDAVLMRKRRVGRARAPARARTLYALRSARCARPARGAFLRAGCAARTAGI